MTMPLSRWLRWLTPMFSRRSRNIAEDRERSHQRRHAVAGEQNALACQTELSRQKLDSCEVQLDHLMLDYMRATGKNWRNDEQPTDDPCDSLRRGDTGDV